MAEDPDVQEVAAALRVSIGLLVRLLARCQPRTSGSSPAGSSSRP
jgi:hypothetical protein